MTVKRALVETPYGYVHLRYSEGRRRPLLALHMSPLSSRMWLPLIERLDRPVVAPDRIGFGFSDSPPLEMTIGDYASATMAAIDQLGLETFDLLGEHTGSVEAVEIARRHPSRVGTVGLIGVPIYSDEEREERLARRGSPPPEPSVDGSHYLDVWHRRLFYREPPYRLEHLHDLTLQEMQSAGPHHAYRAVFAYPTAERLASLKRPVVVFSPDDDLSEQTRRARDVLPPGSTYVDLSELALDLFEVAPDRMTELVDEHLRGT